MDWEEPAEILVEDLDCMPAIKRQRTPPSDQPPSSTPCTPPPHPAGAVAERVTLDVLREWPGLPRGVKFDPSDEDMLWHLHAKVGKGKAEPHPLISEFIISLDEDDGFGYTHPLRLTGVKQDGSVSYFFHKRFKAFNSGNRKGQRLQDVDFGVTFWDKIGRTKPVVIDGICRGGKQIMVLSVVMRKGEKPEKTNWVMHQYHLGRGEDGEGEFVASKIFFQQNTGQSYKSAQGLHLDTTEAVVMDGEAAVDPSSLGPRIQSENQNVDLISVEFPIQAVTDQDRGDSHPNEDPKGGEIELIDSQQHIKDISTYKDLRQTQFSSDAEAERSISGTALIGTGTLENGLIECQNVESSTACSNAGSTIDYSSEFTTCEIFKSKEAMIKWIRDRGRMNGFVIVIKKSESGTQGRKPRLIFGCERGGKYRNHHKKKEEEPEKHSEITGTKKCECPFTLKGNKLATDDDWTLTVLCGVHNHPATEPVEGNSYAGRLSQEESSLVYELYNSSVRPRDILNILKQRDPLNMATVRTIYNARNKFKQMEKAGKLIPGRQINQLTYEGTPDSVKSTES